MSRSKDDSGQAFPCLERGGSGLDLTDGGMTLRQYAAIKLRVPDSGTDWLDKMIRSSQRDEVAAKALQAFVAGAPSGTGFGVSNPHANYNYAVAAYAMADAMLKASGK